MEQLNIIEEQVMALNVKLEKLEEQIISVQQQIMTKMSEMIVSEDVFVKEVMKDVEMLLREKDDCFAEYKGSRKELIVLTSKWRVDLLSMFKADARLTIQDGKGKQKKSLGVSRTLSTSLKGSNLLQSSMIGRTKVNSVGLGSMAHSKFSENWEIGYNEINLLNKLGEGAFGVVYKAKCRGADVAVKVLKNLSLSENAREEFLQECSIMQPLTFPNILLFMGACIEPGHFSLVCELAEGGSLADILEKKQIKLGFKRKMKMAEEIALGMNWLHSMNPPLYHFDLKPENLLLTKDFQIKIADFGVSRIIREENQKKGRDGGTPLYMPPEMFRSNTTLSDKIDVYSYAMVLWEMTTEESPFAAKGIKGPGQLAIALSKGERPDIPDNFPHTLSQLIIACWATSPLDRPSFAEITSRKRLFNDIILEAVSNGNAEFLDLWKSMATDNNGDVALTVSWKTFSNGFLQFMGIPLDKKKKYGVELLCIKDLLGVKESENKKTVKLGSYERFLCLFPPTSKGEEYLYTIRNLLSEDWYFGDIGSKETSDLLNTKKDSFLVRTSESDPNSFVVCTKLHGKISQMRVDTSAIHTTVKNIVKKHHIKAARGNRKYDYLFPPKKSRHHSVPEYQARTGYTQDYDSDSLEEIETSLPRKDVRFIT